MPVGVGDEFTAHAIRAIDELNHEVVLSDAFARQSENSKKFLSTEPAPLTRKPSAPRPLTFLRAGDVLSVELGGRFHAAYVWEVEGLNETPVIEFYADTFSRRPWPVSASPASRICPTRPIRSGPSRRRTRTGHEAENPYPAGACTR
ncbi:hypothetical protein [Streptomyces sp. NBC_00343]|uniref:hypothetical protein n=1 Tax=Streptomyces sp. NBC_00343 TaxID=2975719 RepID=UPI002E27D5E6|nr:hypothetical protein [Streptomyces sp. NBC_00343]